MDIKSTRGKTGDKTHLTRSEIGYISPEMISHIMGSCGEIRGEHRNMKGLDWERFLSDIKKNGVKEHIFIVKDPGKDPVVKEGNHRLDAAKEAGLSLVPVDIRYFGNSQKEGLIYV